MRITAETCMGWILAQAPRFRSSWEKHLQWWGDEEPSLGNNIAAFSRYIVEVIKSNQTEDVKTLFAILERLLTDGDDEVRAGVATNCLENIINRASAGELRAEGFVEHLGKESRAYCLAWDRFTGVKTPGLELEKD
jgi:hypothetical protein